MRKSLLTTLFLCFFFTLCAAQSVDWNAVHEQTIRGIDQLYDLDIDGSLATFNSVCRIAPGDPRGYFFRSMVHFWLYTLAREDKEYDTFLALSEHVITVCENILDTDEDNAKAHFYLGGIYGYRGLAHQAHGSMLKAVTDGRKGFSHLQKAVSLDPELYDAQMGFGLFRYLVAKVPKSLSWILSLVGFEGDLEGGLRSLRLAAEKGVYTKSEACYFLSQFLFNEQRHEEAIEFLKPLLVKYPNNSLFLLTYAGWQSRLGKYDEALASALKAVEINKRKKLPFGEEFSYSTLGNIYYGRNDFARARDNLELFQQKVQTRDYISNWALYRLGMANDILGDRARAIDAYRKIKKGDDKERPGDTYYYRLAQDRIQHPPVEADFILVKASNELGQKNYDRALQYYSEALAKCNGSIDLEARTLYGMQQTNFEKENFAETVIISSRLVALNPPQERWLIPHGYFRLGQAYAKLGKVPEAKGAFEAAEKFDDYDFQSGLTTRIEDELKKLK